MVKFSQGRDFRRIHSRITRRGKKKNRVCVCVSFIGVSISYHSIGTMSSPPTADSHQIRSRLLNRLGIYDAPPPTTTAQTSSTATSQQQPMTAAQVRRLRILRGMGVAVGAHGMYHSPPDGSAIRPPLDGVKPFQAPLNDSTTTTNSPPSELRTTTTSTTPSGSRKIAFQENVSVVPIPTRYEYSDRIKSKIWSNRAELHANAERNAIEFAAEGWNWRNVTEDEGMYICSQSGELVHPIHLQHLVNEEGPQEPAQPTLERGSPVHTSS